MFWKIPPKLNKNTFPYQLHDLWLTELRRACEIALKFSIQCRPPIRSSGSTQGSERPRPAHVARYSRREGAPSLLRAQISSMNLIRAAGLLVKSRQSDIYRGCEAVSWSGDLAARLRRVKYCVGRCSPRELNPLSILQRLRLRQHMHYVYGVRCPRLAYCRFLLRFCVKSNSQPNVGVFLARCWKSDRAATSRLRLLVVAPSGHLLIIRWWWWLRYGDGDSDDDDGGDGDSDGVGLR